MSSQIRDVVVPIKSKIDDRDYRHFTLTHNNLQVLLISDPTTDKAAASLAVNVGSLADPPIALGIAHFLEHMLFLGTAKFPDESSYQGFVSTHGGSVNAWTAAEETVYYFDVDKSYLPQVLDRFSQFFISPLFLESCTSREMNAVHSEHDKNIYNDEWRGYEVVRQVVHPDHPASQFHTGNLETLRDEPLKNGTNIRQCLLDFHKQYYSSNIMKLVIIGHENLDELQKYALQFFTDIPNHNIKPPIFPSLGPNNDTSLILKNPKSTTVLELSPTKQKRLVTLSYLLPSTADYSLSHPTHVISHCLGDEGPGSLLSLLKALRLATSLSSGSSESLSCFSTFQVSVGLTELGLSQITNVIRLTQAYVNIVLRQSSDEVLYSVLNQIQLLDEMNFEFLEKSDVMTTATNLVCQMFRYDGKLVLQNTSILHKIDLPAIRYFLQFLSLDNLSIVISSQDAQRPISLINLINKDGTYRNYEEMIQYEKIPQFSDESLSIHDINKLFNETPNGHNKKWSYEKYYKMRFSQYQLTQDIRTFMDSGLTDNDLKLAIDNEPASYKHCISPNQLLSVPVDNPYIPKDFTLLKSNQQDSDDAMVIYSYNEDVRSFPLQIENNNTKQYQNSLLCLNYLKNESTFLPDHKKPLSLMQFKKLVENLVHDNLVGFDQEHINTSLANISTRDEPTEEFISALFKQTDDDKTIPLPIQNQSCEAVPSKQPEDSEQAHKEEVEATYPPEEHDEEQGRHDEEQSRHDKEQSRHDEDDEEQGHDEDDEDQEPPPPPAQIQTLDSFFAILSDKLCDDDNDSNQEKLNTIKQFIPPTQLPVPLPSKHFSISNTTQTQTSYLIQPPIELWYKFTDSYKTPNVDISITISIPSVDQIYLQLYSLSLNDLLTEMLYPAALCGVTFSIVAAAESIILSVQGHREGSGQVITNVLDYIQNKPELFTIDILERQVDRFRRSLNSMDQLGAIQQLAKHVSHVFSGTSTHWTTQCQELEELLSPLPTGGNRLSQFPSHYLQSLEKSVVMSVFGNVTSTYAIKLGQSVAIAVDANEIPSHKIQRGGLSITLNQSVNKAVLLPNGNINDNQSALFNYYFALDPFRSSFNKSKQLIALSKRAECQHMFDPKTLLDDNNIITNSSTIFNNSMTFYGTIIYNYFLSHVMSDHVYDSLRTKQQLGYIIFSQNHYNAAGYGLLVLAQTAFKTSYVDQRIEYYLRQELRDYLTTGGALSPQQFVSNIGGAQCSLLARVPNLQSEAANLRSSISNKSFDFLRPLVLALLLPYLNRKLILAFYNHFYRSILNRRKLAIHLVQQKDTTDQDNNISTYSELVPHNVTTTLQEALSLRHLYPLSRY